jgi:FtsZ-binding cell division protein ZapB
VQLSVDFDSSDEFEVRKDIALVDTKPFEVLEEKINQVLIRLETLQVEKKELEDQVLKLRTQYEEAAQKLDEVTRERDDLRDNQRDTEQEEIIRSKITALLAKLETS